MCALVEDENFKGFQHIQAALSKDFHTFTGVFYT